MSDRVTGRPSGRCAATEALNDLLDDLTTVFDDDRLKYVEAQITREVLQAARAALASPCCVSAADQEQVKEALRRIVGESYNLLTQGESPTQRRGPSAQRIYDEAHAALALLGSNEEEER